MSLADVSSLIEVMPEILENLGAEPDLAPLPRARNLGTGRARLRDGMGRHPRGTVAEEHDDAAAFLLEPLQGGVHRIGAAEDIADDIGAMQPRQHVPAVADAAVDEGHVLDGVERRHIGIACKRPDLALHREFADALDELVARLPVRDDIGDRNLLELVALGKRRHARPPHHRAVVVHQFGKHADRRQPGKTAEINAGLGVAGAHQHAAVLGNERKYMAGPHEVACAGVAIGERAHRIGPLFARDAGREAMPDIDRDGEGGTERRIVRRHHGIEVQALGLLGRQRRADDARGMADDESHLLGRA